MPHTVRLQNSAVSSAPHAPEAGRALFSRGARRGEVDLLAHSFGTAVASALLRQMAPWRFRSGAIQARLVARGGGRRWRFLRVVS